MLWFSDMVLLLTLAGASRDGAGVPRTVFEIAPDRLLCQTY